MFARHTTSSIRKGDAVFASKKAYCQLHLLMQRKETRRSTTAAICKNTRYSSEYFYSLIQPAFYDTTSRHKLAFTADTDFHFTQLTAHI